MTFRAQTSTQAMLDEYSAKLLAKSYETLCGVLFGLHYQTQDIRYLQQAQEITLSAESLGLDTRSWSW